MHIEQDGQANRKNSDFANLFILWVIASCIGVYLIATTALIAKDGVNFIHYAQQIGIAPLEIIKHNYQHPGYPGLILTGHQIAQAFHTDTSILSWIYCAQSTALLFRLLTFTVLYFISKHLIGAKLGFWAILIFILLPDPAEFGSDALSDWPHLFFLSLGLLLLFKGATKAQWPLFGLAGLVAGAGYLIRPECMQVVLLGCLWLGWQLIQPRTINRTQACYGLAILVVGFAALAGPYMAIKSDIFPKKHLNLFSQNATPTQTFSETGPLPSTQPKPISQTIIISKATWKLIGNMCDTLMWFFVPALWIGLYRWFKTRTWHEPEVFFITAMTLLNIMIMFWLFAKYGYMSNRHTLPLLMLPILFVPVGLQECAIGLQQKFSGKACTGNTANPNRYLWFLALVLAGAAFCAPKLLSPIRIEKQEFRVAAKWLETNTDPGAIIAVPDERISFYAQRKGILYKNELFPENVDYLVTIPEKQKKGMLPAVTPSGTLEYEYPVAKKEKGVIVSIYKMNR